MILLNRKEVTCERADSAPGLKHACDFSFIFSSFLRAPQQSGVFLVPTLAVR